MKKLITLLLVLCGGISQASADYYVFYNQDGGWNNILGTLTDGDGDGVYSAIINLEDASKIGWGLCTIVLSRENTLGDAWGNVIWANTGAEDKSVFSENDFTLSDSWTSDGKLNIPITAVTPNTYAVKLEYTPTTHKFSATRMIEFASSNDDWHTSTPVYLQETAHDSKIFQGNLELPKDTEFKFVVNGNSNDKTGTVLWYGYTSGTYISESGNNMKITKDGVYTITVNLGNYNYVAPELITIPASVGSYGKATLCSEYALDFSDFSGEDAAVKAYRITGAADGVLTPTRVTGRVKAGTGLYIEGAANASINVPTTIETTDPGTNFLKGVTENTNIVQSPAAGVNNYILTVNTQSGTADKPRFYLVNGASGNTVKAGKAYLQITSGGGARDFYWFAEDVTAIDAVKQEQKVDGEAYNLAGQRVSKPSKGLYIVNGKKVIIK